MRRNPSEFQSCEAPDFNKKVCLTYDDLSKFYSTLIKCKEWPADVPLMTEPEVKAWAKILYEEKLP